MKCVRIRTAEQKHYDRLGQIMYEAVRQGQSPYSEMQREAWMPAPREGTVWNDRLSTQHICIAQLEDDDVIGFMSLEPLADSGYIDFAYILPAARGQGLFRQLYNQIETTAKSLRFVELSTHASLMAHPAFLAMGFEVVTPENVSFNGAEFSRYEMRKRFK